MPKCAFCSKATVDINSRYADKTPRFKTCDDGLKCSKCRGFSCRICLELISDEANKKGITDRWLRQVEQFVHGDQVPCNFIGHCCEWKEQIDKTVRKSSFERRYDGHLFLPEYGLLIDSPTNGMVDVHGFGPTRKCSGIQGVKGLWHGVVTEDVAIDCERENVVPDGTCCEEILSRELLSYKIRKFEGNGCTNFNIEVRHYLKTTVFPKDQKGMHPTVQDLRTSQLVSSTGGNTEAVDALLLLGHVNGTSETHCLCFRWFNLVSPKNTNEVQLYNDIVDILKKKKGGWEVIRRGGSAGETSPNRDFFNFIHVHGAFPRKACGVKFVRHKLHWNLFYISPGEESIRKVVKLSRYSQPVRGGSFAMPEDLFRKHEVLIDFMEVKAWTALILQEHNDTSEHQVQAEAVENECRKISRVLKIHEDREDRLALLSSYNNYTLVCYPVGYHVDFVRNWEPFLENKIVFENKTISHSCGRGGLGSNAFAFALLDW